MPSFEYVLREPATKEDILTQLREMHRASMSFWNGFSTDAFFAPVGNGWSPAGNVRHLNKALQPLIQGLKLPRLVPRVLFGKSHEPSRSYAVVRDTYLAILGQGAGAGKFGPEPFQPQCDAEAQRAKLMAKHEAIAKSLTAAIEGWSEEDLDHYRFPHPLLGKMTVREMLFFTVYHNTHHPRSVATRLVEASRAKSESPA
jgi:hypothetical protein